MTIQQIWNEFLEKLRSDSLTENDFANDTKLFLLPFLTGPATQARRSKFLSSTVEFVDGEDKGIVILTCRDDEYRFDFIVTGDCWQLSFIECITLPVAGIGISPYSNFSPLPEKEAWIRAERTVSQMVHFYCRLKKFFGTDEALSWFIDGAGEFLCAKSWVPFYTASKAFIAFCAWIESRVHGENVSIVNFTDSKCVMRFHQHLWFRVYHAASHIKTQITLTEYTGLFEYIWKDRALHAGWNITFTYSNDDTVLTFTKPMAD